MKTETLEKPQPQCVENKHGVLLCYIPERGATIYLVKGKHSLAKNERKYAKPIRKDVFNRAVGKKPDAKRPMTEEEIELAEQAIKEREDVLKTIKKEKLKKKKRKFSPDTKKRVGYRYK